MFWLGILCYILANRGIYSRVVFISLKISCFLAKITYFGDIVILVMVKPAWKRFSLSCLLNHLLSCQSDLKPNLCMSSLKVVDSGVLFLQFLSISRLGLGVDGCLSWSLVCHFESYVA